MFVYFCVYLACVCPSLLVSLMFYYGFKIMYSTDWWDTKNFGRGSCTITIRFSYEYEQNFFYKLHPLHSATFIRAETCAGQLLENMEQLAFPRTQCSCIT